MNENQRWYYAIEEQTHGPVETVELERLIEDGVVLPSTWIVAEGTEDWSAAKESAFASCFDVPTQEPIVSPTKIDAGALSAVGSSQERQLVDLGESTLRRRWRLLASGFLVLVVVGALLHHTQRQRSTGEVIAELHAKFETQGSNAPVPTLASQEQKQTQFDAILTAFLSLNRRKLPADVQGFRFGSSMDDVSANCLKQYGQPLATTNPGALAFVVRTAKCEDQTAFSVDTTSHDSWIMVFGFYQERLVYISKTYRHTIDPRKTSDFMSNYFKVVASRDTDLLGVPGFFETDNYVGFLDFYPNSSNFNTFRLFETEFLRNVLSSHFRKPFQELVDTIAQTDFNGPTRFGGDVYMTFRQFPSKYSYFDEFKLTKEQAESNQFTEGMPEDPCAYLGVNLKMMILQTLFSPLSGKIQSAKEDSSNIAYHWQAQDRYFVTVHEDSVEVGRHPSTPNPDRL